MGQQRGFIDPKSVGQEPSPAHFHPAILPELESLYAALLPILGTKNPFIYLSSSGRGEGATTIAWALAYYLAMRENVETLFVDGDTIRPSIRPDESMPEAGLSDYLHGSEEFELLAFQTELNRLAAIHSGRIKSSYVHLSQERAQRFVEESTRYYRAVVFNARPGFDKYAELWGRVSDTVLLLASYRSTKREILDRTIRGFQTASIPITGLLFNKQEHPIPEFFYKRI